jgi:hypothetical protein
MAAALVLSQQAATQPNTAAPSAATSQPDTAGERRGGDNVDTDRASEPTPGNRGDLEFDDNDPDFSTGINNGGSTSSEV